MPHYLKMHHQGQAQAQAPSVPNFINVNINTNGGLMPPMPMSMSVPYDHNQILNQTEIQMRTNQAMMNLAGSMILLFMAMTANSEPKPLFLRSQLGGLFSRSNGQVMESRYGSMNNRQGHANGAGFVGGGGHSHGGARGAGYSGMAGNDHRGSGHSGGNRYGDHHGSGHFGGNGNGLGPGPSTSHRPGYGQGHYGHGGNSGNFGHMGGGNIGYMNGGSAGQGVNANTNANSGGLLRSLFTGVKGRMKLAYLAMKHALKAMFYRGELGGDDNNGGSNNGNGGNYGNNYAGNYAYDRSSAKAKAMTQLKRRAQDKNSIEFGRTGRTYLRIGLNPESPWPRWLRFLG